MNRKLIWAAAAPTCLIVISALLLLLGSTPTAPERSTTITPPRDTRSAVPTTSTITTEPFVPSDVEPVESSTGAMFEASTSEPSMLDPEDILNAPIEELILADDRGELTVQTMTDAVPVSPLLSGVSVGIPDAGGPVALAELDVDSLLQTSPANSDTDETKDTKESTVATVPDGTGDDPDEAKPDDDNSKKDADKDDEDKHVHVTVSLIKPKGEVVKPRDEVMVRSRTKGLKRAFVLVRARQKDAPWWVQEEAIRNGYYFRSRAQFGNAKTLDGTRFRMVVAFTDEDGEVPEAGVFFHEIPLNYTLSQEFDVILDKD